MNLLPLALAAAISLAIGIWFRPGSRLARRSGADPVVVVEVWLIATDELEPQVVSIRPSRSAKLRVISGGVSERKLAIPSLGIHVPILPGRTMTVDLSVGKPGTAEIQLDGVKAGLLVIESAQSR